MDTKGAACSFKGMPVGFWWLARVRLVILIFHLNAGISYHIIQITKIYPSTHSVVCTLTKRDDSDMGGVGMGRFSQWCIPNWIYTSVYVCVYVWQHMLSCKVFGKRASTDQVLGKKGITPHHTMWGGWPCPPSHMIATLAFDLWYLIVLFINFKLDHRIFTFPHVIDDDPGWRRWGGGKGRHETGEDDQSLSTDVNAVALHHCGSSSAVYFIRNGDIVRTNFHSKRNLVLYKVPIIILKNLNLRCLEVLPS